MERLWLLALVSGFFVVGCGESDDKSVCSAGATQTCACAGGGSGVQTCNSSGSAWGTCQSCSTTKQDSGPTTPDKGTKVTCKTQMLHPVGTSFCFDKFDQTGKTKSEAITYCASQGKNGKVCTLAQIKQAVSTLGWKLTKALGTTDGTGCCCPCGSWPGSPQTFWTPGGSGSKCECWGGKGNTHHKTYFRCCTDTY